MPLTPKHRKNLSTIMDSTGKYPYTEDGLAKRLVDAKNTVNNIKKRALLDDFNPVKQNAAEMALERAEKKVKNYIERSSGFETAHRFYKKVRTAENNAKGQLTNYFAPTKGKS